MPIDRKNIKFDLDAVSLKELQTIQSMIMGRIVQDLQAKIDPNALYDSHSSNHSNHSDAVAAVRTMTRMRGTGIE